MTGVLSGIIGMDKDICLERARKQILYPLRCAEGAASIQGVHVLTALQGGLRPAVSIERFSAAAG
jgi:calcineurin-like phosphoesterase